MVWITKSPKTYARVNVYLLSNVTTPFCEYGLKDMKDFWWHCWYALKNCLPKVTETPFFASFNQTRPSLLSCHVRMINHSSITLQNGLQTPFFSLFCLAHAVHCVLSFLDPFERKEFWFFDIFVFIHRKSGRLN